MEYPLMSGVTNVLKMAEYIPVYSLGHKNLHLRYV